MNPFFPPLQKLADCLAEQVETDERPALNFIGVVPGDLAVSDYAFGDDGDGMGWVRLVSISPVSGVGIANTQPGNCSSESGLVIEVGILRCYRTMNDDGTPPSPEEMKSSAVEQMEDAATMMRAIVCCLGSKDYVLGTYRPAGPLGDVYGGLWTLQTVAS